MFDDAGDARDHPTDGPTESDAQADVVTKSDVQRNLVTLLLQLLQGRLPHQDDLEADDAPAARQALPPLPVKILLSFRDDYLGRVRELLAGRPELIDQALRVAPPAAEALPTIISGPFERYPGHFAHPLSSALARRLVDVMSKQFGSGDLGLSEVQTVCLRLWQSDDPDALLTAKGPQGLLEDYLGEAIETMPGNLQPAAIQILSEMVTSAGTRNVISASDLVQRVRGQGSDISEQTLRDALERLSDSRLVNRERRRDVDLYEITSEFLVPWISQRREALRRAQERQHERRRLRIFGAIAGVLVIIACAVTALAIWALAQRSRASNEATTARSLALAADAKSDTGDQLGHGLALALAALAPYRAGAASPLAATSVMIGDLEAVRLNGLDGILSTPQGGVDSIAFSPNGAILAAGMSDGSVRLYNASNHRLLTVLTSGDGSALDSLAFSPTGVRLAAGGADGIVRLWDLTDRHPVTAIVARRHSAVRALAFSPHGQLLAAGLDSGAVRQWNTKTYEPAGPTLVGSLPPGPHAADTYSNLPGVDGLAFSSNGRTLAASEGGTVNGVFVWDARSGRQVGRALYPHILVQSMAVSPDGRSVAIGTDGAVEYRTIVGGPKHRATLATRGTVGTVAFSADGRELGAGDDTGEAYLWNLRTRHRTGSFSASSQAQINAVAFRPGSHELAIGDSGGAVTLWDPNSRGLGPVLRTSADTPELAFSPSGGRVGTVDSNGQVSVRNVADGRRLMRRQDNDQNGSATVAFNQGGTELADVDRDRRVTIWRVPSGTTVATLPALRNADTTLAVVTPDLGTLIATEDPVYKTRSVRLWRLPSGASLPPITLPKHESADVLALDAGGHELAIGSPDGTVWVWEIGSRVHQRVRLSTADPSAIDGLAFSRDGRTLAEISDDATVRVWNATTGRRIGSTMTAGPTPFYGNGYSIYKGGVDVALSPDGRILVTNDQSSVRLWDVAASEPLGATLNNVTVENLAYSPSGRAVAVGEADGVGLWSSFLWGTLATCAPRFAT